jgi:hypothetical protein
MLTLTTYCYTYYKLLFFMSKVGHQMFTSDGQPLNLKYVISLWWIFSWAMSHICANDEYRFRVGATNRPENILVHYVSVVSLSAICM